MSATFCEHPFDQLTFSRHGYANTNDDLVFCKLCKGQLGGPMHVSDFLQLRIDIFQRQTGFAAAPCMDMFYRRFDVGDTVVYPAMSGRSAQLSSGVVEEINPNRKADPLTPEELMKIQARGRVGEPYSLKIQPTGMDSRWTQHYSQTWNSKTSSYQQVKPRAVTLWANAGSAVPIFDMP